MKLGKAAMDALKSEITGLLQPGDELVVAGAVGLGGTSGIAEAEYEYLRNYFSESFLRNSRNLKRDHGVIKKDLKDSEGQEDQKQKQQDPKNSQVWKLAEKAGASALYAMGEGGFLSALWKMAEASQVGLTAEFKRVPIRQETIEICEKFDLNPYRLQADGAVLIGIPAGEALVQELGRMGYMASVIGQTNSGNDRLLYSGESARYLERPAEDEIRKVIKE